MKRPEIPAWMNTLAPNAKLGSAEMAIIYKCAPQHVWAEVKEGRMPAHTSTVLSKRRYSAKLSGSTRRDLHKWEMSAVRLDVAQRQKKFDEKAKHEAP